MSVRVCLPLYACSRNTKYVKTKISKKGGGREEHVLIHLLCEHKSVTFSIPNHLSEQSFVFVGDGSKKKESIEFLMHRK